MTAQERLDRIFAEYIKYKESENGYTICFICGKAIRISEAQIMHYIPRRHTLTRYNEFNCHAGCKDCNEFLEGNLEQYKQHLIEKYDSEIIEYLTQESNRDLKLYEVDYKEMFKIYRNALKELKRCKQ
jgi:hypothetical protein